MTKITKNPQFEIWPSGDEAEAQEFDPYGLVPSAEEAALENMEPEPEDSDSREDQKPRIWRGQVRKRGNISSPERLDFTGFFRRGERRFLGRKGKYTCPSKANNYQITLSLEPQGFTAYLEKIPLFLKTPILNSRKELTKMAKNPHFGAWPSDDDVQEFDPYGLAPPAEEAALENMEPEPDDDGDKTDFPDMKSRRNAERIAAEAFGLEPEEEKQEKITLAVKVPMTAPASFPEKDPYRRPFTEKEAYAVLRSGGIRNAKVEGTYIPDPDLFDERFRSLGRSQAIVAQVQGQRLHLFLQYRAGDGTRRPGWRIIKALIEHDVAMGRSAPFDFAKHGYKVGAKIDRPVAGTVVAIYDHFAHVRTRQGDKVLVYPGDLAEFAANMPPGNGKYGR